MDIQTRKEQKSSVITIAGRMDAVTAPEFDIILKQQIDAGEIFFVVDFNNLDYISSAGLRSLLAAAKLLKGKNGQLHFANITGTVKEVFEISGFGSIFQIYDSVESALLALAS